MTQKQKSKKGMSLVEAFSMKETLDEANAAINHVYENAARNKARKAAEKENELDMSAKRAQHERSRKRSAGSKLLIRDDEH